jgi:DNA-3-methyladenine glycosylase
MPRRTREFVFPPLPGSFYDRDVIEVARALLGLHLVHASDDGLTCGVIVETEAYLPQDDPANHAARGRSRRNASMFGPPGHAYVYAIHSRWCLNAVTEPEGVACAVLIRAVEPVEGLDLMRARRCQRSGVREILDRELARGPARLCEAFAIDRALDGWDLTCGQRLWIGVPQARDTAGPSGQDESTAAPAHAIITTPRVGVTSAHDLPLRFYLAGNPFVSNGPRGQV